MTELVLLAAAVLVAPGARTARLRLAEMSGRPSRRLSGKQLITAKRWRRSRTPAPDPLQLAMSWDLLGACLRAGLPVPAAVRVVADRVPGDGGKALRTTADLLALGADAEDAWAPAASVPATAPLARGARRTARSGTELATVAAALADEVRTSATDTAEARAQRAGVLIAGPLGLCFLPAFVCLGVVPVVAGLAGRLGLSG
ncbi:type II secretion system F family protein [Kibdelosporangium persicum]|uniref:Bacterial type II secretion system protein F domain n=1 Tax=Kibdelosporangium persicum TaxID=2698649 RepID=A0ABX2F4Y3_9PSEU|nr:type II secretion system F family protein [Kibdelosporangium persicum]NRN66243.1 Bacterial type II secretion system protein F domain [Kibdelosporangium persicum]